MTIDRTRLGEFFCLQGVKFGKCLEPCLHCNRSAIRSHSIQNRRVIALLAKDDHVLAWQPRFSEAGPDIGLRPVGRNQASTFTGFCSEHDAELFKPLDTKPLDIADKEQLFLLAYRTITYELHAVGLAAIRHQSLYYSLAERGLGPRDETSPAGQKALEQMILSWAIWRYRAKYLDEPFVSGKAADVGHVAIEFDDQVPCLAASSFITMGDRSLSDELAGLAVNVLPVSATKTVAVFSYANQDQGQAHTMLDRILTSKDGYQKYELSKLILGRMENVLFAPSHVERWSADKMRKVTQAFLGNVSYGEPQDDPELFLF